MRWPVKSIIVGLMGPETAHLQKRWKIGTPAQRRRLVDVMIVITDTKMRTMNTNVEFIICALMIIFIVKILGQRSVKKMRLIDANKVEIGFDELCQSPYFKSDVNAKHGAETLMDLCVRSDSHKPNTIDPEALPIVQELRKELERVTRERDAAIRDLKECAVENYMECNYCKNEIKKYVSEICRNCNDGSNFEHRGEGNRS